MTGSSKAQEQTILVWQRAIEILEECEFKADGGRASASAASRAPGVL